MVKPDAYQERNQKEFYTFVIFTVPWGKTQHCMQRLLGETLGLVIRQREGARTVGKHSYLVSIGMGKAE